MDGASTALRIRIFAASLMMSGGLLLIDSALWRWPYRWQIASFLIVSGLFVFSMGDALRTFRHWAFIAILAYFGCAIVARGLSEPSDPGRGWLFRLVSAALFLYCFRFKDVVDEPGPFDSRALCMPRWSERGEKAFWR